MTKLARRPHNHYDQFDSIVEDDKIFRHVFSFGNKIVNKML